MNAFIGLFTRSWLALDPLFDPVCPVDVLVWGPGEWRSVSIIMLYIHPVVKVRQQQEKKVISKYVGQVRTRVAMVRTGEAAFLSLLKAIILTQIDQIQKVRNNPKEIKCSPRQYLPALRVLVSHPLR